MNKTKIISGRYEIKRRLGAGGMSTVYLAVDNRLEREVAIKLLAEHLADDSAFISRFQREALSAAKLIHPNIVQVYDSGFDEEAHQHYIVMEYVDGVTCSVLLREYGQLTAADTIDIITQACRGFDYAHRKGVVHRDVKPGNLLRSEEGVIKLADFGIALLVTEQSRITQVGSVIGTAAYLSPEQSRGREADARSDIYALGVVTYQLLAGKLPYDAPSLTELALMREQQTPPPLRSLNADVTPAIEAAVNRALAPNPDDRYQTAHEMERALLDALSNKFGSVTGVSNEDKTELLATKQPPKRTRQPRTATPASSPKTPTSQGQSAPKKQRRGAKRLGAFLLVLALFAGLALAISVGLKQNNDTQELRLNDVVKNNVNDSVDSLKQLIRNNTQ